MILEAYFIIGFIVWGLLLSSLWNNGLTIQVTLVSTLGWLCIVVGWPFVIGWIVTNLLDAISEAIEVVQSGNSDLERGDEDDEDS